MKIKSWNVTVIDNPNTMTVSENDEFYTTDTEAFLIFNLQDKDFHPTSATVTLHNRTDGSVVNEDVLVVNGVIEYEMRREAIRHAGVWRTQLVYEQDKDGVPEKYTSKSVSFGVSGHLLENKEPPLFLVENWNNFLLSAENLIEGWRQSEALRVTAERKRDTAEDSRISEENKRVSAENDRQSNESVRQSNETARQQEFEANETVRQSQEESREIAENQRASSESTRVDNEQQRETNESLRESSETERVSSEQNRVTAENERNDLYGLVQQKLENGEFVGEKGDTGDGLEYVWRGTQLGVRKESETEYVYVDLKSELGELESNIGKIKIGSTWYTPQIVTELPASPGSDVWYIVLE